MFTPMRLVGTACGGLLPSSAKADATSLREGGSAHAMFQCKTRFFDSLKGVHHRTPFSYAIISEIVCIISQAVSSTKASQAAQERYISRACTVAAPSW